MKPVVVLAPFSERPPITRESTRFDLQQYYFTKELLEYCVENDVKGVHAKTSKSELVKTILKLNQNCKRAAE